MEDYRTGAGGDDGNSDIDAIDFEALARNLQVWVWFFLLSSRWFLGRIGWMRTSCLL
jgi:hypothetical protein